jgi:hypothetical protein
LRLVHGLTVSEAQKAAVRQPIGDSYVHSALLHAWWQITQFCQNKIATAGLELKNCLRQFFAQEIATGNFLAWF